MTIRRAALQAIQKYGSDVYGILSQLNIKVLEAELPARIPEIFFGDYVVLKSDLSNDKKRFYLAHALGHYFLHREGNYFVLFYVQSRDGNTRRKLMSLPDGYWNLVKKRQDYEKIFSLLSQIG